MLCKLIIRLNTKSKREIESTLADYGYRFAYSSFVIYCGIKIT